MQWVPRLDRIAELKIRRNKALGGSSTAGVRLDLDIERRLSLFDAVGGLGAQSWFSGTDIDDFSGLRDQAQLIRIAVADTDSGSATIEVM